MKKPVIGVIPLWDDEKNSIWMLPDYLDGLRGAGALPVVLPLEADEADIRQLYSLCDGLLFTGGMWTPPCTLRPPLPCAVFPVPGGTPWRRGCSAWPWRRESPCWASAGGFNC